jgi:hypothetical protein
MGVPTLQAPAGVRPVPGSTFTLTLGNLPFSVGLVSMGFSNTTSGPFTLPLDLSQFGLSVGCFLRAEVVVTQLLIGAGNSATWSLGLPNSSSYLGVSFYNQGFAIDPPANNAGVTVSNAGRGSIGV